MRLDYPNTCPDIDRHKDGLFSEIERELDLFLEEICPLLDGTSVANDLISTTAKRIFAEVENTIEEIRNTNEDMRKQAEYQLSELQHEIEQLEYKVLELER